MQKAEEKILLNGKIMTTKEQNQRRISDHIASPFAQLIVY